jgi:hypothetical protein
VTVTLDAFLPADSCLDAVYADYAARTERPVPFDVFVDVIRSSRA